MSLECKQCGESIPEGADYIRLFDDDKEVELHYPSKLNSCMFDYVMDNMTLIEQAPTQEDIELMKHDL